VPRPIEALIHPDALAHNLGRVRQRAPDARVWAVVKADAYGHGIERVFPALRGADGFALLDLAEAERLRALDWRGPILLLEGCFEPRDLELCSRLNLWHAVHCDAQIDWLAAHKTHQPHRVFLKMNSGMNRLGFTPATFRSAWARLNALPQVDEISLMTHFSDADGPRGIAHQVAAFESASRDLPGERSLSNSAAILRHAGVRTRTLGRVSMDMLAVDLEPVPGAGFGSEVTLWGRGPQGSVLPIDEVAQAAGTLGYELMCALAPRVPVVEV
jgi:alanine racemase